jgi:hypothetical protein
MNRSFAHRPKYQYILLAQTAEKLSRHPEISECMQQMTLFSIRLKLKCRIQFFFSTGARRWSLVNQISRRSGGGAMMARQDENSNVPHLGRTGRRLYTRIIGSLPPFHGGSFDVLRCRCRQQCTPQHLNLTPPLRADVLSSSVVFKVSNPAF